MKHRTKKLTPKQRVLAKHPHCMTLKYSGYNPDTYPKASNGVTWHGRWGQEGTPVARSPVRFRRTPPTLNCPHGYDECWQGCVPGRLRKVPFSQHPADTPQEPKP